MCDALDLYKALPLIPQNTIDRLLAKGVPVLALGNASPFGEAIKMARGTRTSDGRFEPNETGHLHLAVLVYDLWHNPVDVVCWLPKTGLYATYEGKAFAVGAEQIHNPGNCAFGRGIVIHSTILDWLRAERQGIVILKPKLAFDNLRDCQAVVAEDRQHGNVIKEMLKPRRTPRILVRKPVREAA